MTPAMPLPKVPAFSVILPTHNRPALLAEAIASLAGQSFTDFEIIVIDDASSPPVDAIHLSGLANQPVQVLRNDLSQGGAASKSAGIRKARGRWVAFLDDDDLLAEDHLQVLASALADRTEVEVCFIDVAWFGCESAQTSERNHREATWQVIDRTRHHRLSSLLVLFEEGLTEALIRSTPMQFQRPVVRRDVFERVGSFRSECLLWDCDWAIRASLSARCAYLDRPIYRQREGQGYFTRAGRKVATGESICEIVAQLRTMPPRPLSRSEARLLRDLQAEKVFDLAFVQAQHGLRRLALGSWLRSQLLRPRLSTLKFPLGVLLGRHQP
jgi:glycosyltransferase involved in cell wall biosynthesis